MAPITRLATLAALVAPVAAFRAPLMMSTREGMSKSVPFLKKNGNLAGLPASQAEFDPIGFSDYVPMPWLIESEIKHGRVAMLATLGYIATDVGLRLPGAEHQYSSLEAHDALVQNGIMGQLLIWILPLELLSAAAIVGTFQGSGRKPGSYFFDPLNLGGKMSAEKMTEMETKEIKNGRLAMLAIGGILTQAALTGKGFPYF